MTAPEITARQWSLTIPAPCDWLTANDHDNRWQRASRIRSWRDAAAIYARQAKLPTGLARVRIDAVARFPGRARVRDAANLAPTLKAAIDGLTPAKVGRGPKRSYAASGYGLIPDDDDKHLDGPYITIGEPLPVAQRFGTPGVLVLTIREAT